MVCGGVEKELITILKRFDRDRFDISLLLLYDSGDNITSQLPSYVNVIDLSVDKDYYFADLATYVKKRIKYGKLKKASEALYKRLFRKIPVPAFSEIDSIPNLEETFDIAVCYHAHSPVCLRYVSEKIIASQYFLWIHNDFTTTGYKVDLYREWLNKYQRFICVSTVLKNEFLEICPEFSSQTTVAHNIIDKDEIIEKMHFLDDDIIAFQKDSALKILTVGRFVEQKGFDLAIRACKLLVTQGYNVRWYAIGYGDELERMQSLISELELNNYFIILGRKDNPYPYMKYTDLYVQTSRHEGYAITIEEVKAIGSYIIATDFAGVREQLLNEKYGTVIRDFTPRSIAESIIKFINSPKDHKVIMDESNDLNWAVIESYFL